MVGANKPHDRLPLDDELYGWPSAVREQGAWVRKTEDAPTKKLSGLVQEEETANAPQDDDWFLGAYRRYHAGLKDEKPQRTRRQPLEDKRDNQPAVKPEAKLASKRASRRSDALENKLADEFADKLAAQLAGKLPGSLEEVPYEERVTVTMFVRRNRPAPAATSGAAVAPSQPASAQGARAPASSDTSRTRSELYREAQRRGIEGRSRMNKRQLAEALGDKEGKPSPTRR